MAVEDDFLVRQRSFLPLNNALYWKVPTLAPTHGNNIQRLPNNEFHDFPLPPRPSASQYYCFKSLPKGLDLCGPQNLPFLR